MRLKFTGHNTKPQIKYVNPETLRKRCGKPQNTACFNENSQWTEKNNVLKITFNPVIYLNNKLKGSAKKEALAHEKRHFRDFRGLARKLRSELADRIQKRRYSSDYMEKRWAWFHYDLCLASRAYHKRIGAMVDICIRPSSSRPH